MSDGAEINFKFICKKWGEYGIGESFRNSFGENGLLDERKEECLKDTLAYPHFKSGIWKLEVSVKGQSFPVVLKIMKRGKAETKIEVNMYRKLNTTLQDIMPQVYYVRSEAEHKWILMEYVQQINEQIVFHPKYFEKIIPALAKMHSLTFYKLQEELFAGWLPSYHSDAMINERDQTIEKTKNCLDEAMKRSNLKQLLKPSYTLLQKILQKGPIFFPEVSQAGQSITHNDLHLRNIGCNHVSKNQDWPIKFIDWESAKMAPCFFDVVNLLGIHFAYYQEFKSDEDHILQHCILLYANEMRKHGVNFNEDPMKLYKMAYLQRVLEYDLYFHLTKGLELNEIQLLPIFLEKINVWGKELGLH